MLSFRVSKPKIVKYFTKKVSFVCFGFFSVKIIDICGRLWYNIIIETEFNRKNRRQRVLKFRKNRKGLICMKKNIIKKIYNGNGAVVWTGGASECKGGIGKLHLFYINTIGFVSLEQTSETTYRIANVRLTLAEIRHELQEYLDEHPRILFSIQLYGWKKVKFFLFDSVDALMPCIKLNQKGYYYLCFDGKKAVECGKEVAELQGIPLPEMDLTVFPAKERGKWNEILLKRNFNDRLSLTSHDDDYQEESLSPKGKDDLIVKGLAYECKAFICEKTNDNPSVNGRPLTMLGKW